MIYDGVLAQILGIDLESMKAALYKQFGARKVKAADMNWDAILAGKEFAAENLPKADPYRIERMDANQGKFIIEGNAARGPRLHVCGRHGGHLVSHHPSSSMIESLIGYMKRFRKDPETGSRPMPSCRPRMNWPPSAW